jgi:hypothetical protein
VDHEFLGLYNFVVGYASFMRFYNWLTVVVASAHVSEFITPHFEVLALRGAIYPEGWQKLSCFLSMGLRVLPYLGQVYNTPHKALLKYCNVHHKAARASHFSHIAVAAGVGS